MFAGSVSRVNGEGERERGRSGDYLRAVRPAARPIIRVRRLRIMARRVQRKVRRLRPR